MPCQWSSKGKPIAAWCTGTRIALALRQLRDMPVVYDLRSFIQRLEQDGELLRIARPVQRRYELAAVMAAAERES